MKKLLLISFALLISVVVEAQEKLTNQAVVEMVELGFEKELIIEKINSSTCEFQTDIEALKLLKSKGVSSVILTAMVKASKPAAAKAKTGIYFINDSTEVQLMPTVFSGSKTNTLASIFSYGIASAKVKSIIGGAKSPNVVPNGECVFVFYFDSNKADNFGQNDWWFKTATSPNEFALARFGVNEKKNYRELEVGSINTWSGSNTGVTENLICNVTIEQRADGAYLVTPTEPLTAGEYCFYYKGIIPQGGYNNQSAFDFSIAAAPESPVQEPFVPTAGYVSRGQAVDGLPIGEGLLHVGQFGGWNGFKYTKGLYIEPCGRSGDPKNNWAEARKLCTNKGMTLPSRDQLKQIVTQSSIAENSGYAFTTNYYWSSGSTMDNLGWCVQVPTGKFQSLAKGVAAYVRCVKEY